MSHAQIWDDTALIDVWNEALEEYRKYHSIHVKGGVVEQEIVSEDIEDEVPITQPLFEGTGDMNAVQTDAIPQESVAHKSFHSTANDANRFASDGVNVTSTLPQHLIGSVQDEGLKNLLMSWYYAGYYTGLHEGQQQARQGGTRA